MFFKYQSFFFRALFRFFVVEIYSVDVCVCIFFFEQTQIHNEVIACMGFCNKHWVTATYAHFTYRFAGDLISICSKRTNRYTTIKGLGWNCAKCLVSTYVYTSLDFAWLYWHFGLDPIIPADSFDHINWKCCGYKVLRIHMRFKTWWRFGRVYIPLKKRHKGKKNDDFHRILYFFSFFSFCS